MLDPPFKPVASADALEAEVRAVAAALLGDAVARVADPGRNGREEAVHEARKRIKELRALLRLVQSNLVGPDGRPIVDAEDDACRAVANGLGAARDAAVRVQTLDALKKRHGHELSPETLAPLRAELVAARERVTAGAGGDGLGSAFEAARGILSAARERAERWRIKPPDRGRGDAPADAWRVIGPNVQRLYRRGRRAMRAAVETDDAKVWHAWRKRAKDLRHALELLRAAAPALLGGAAQAARDLTRDLGEDHDLAVLLDAARGSPGACDGQCLSTLTALVNRRRAQLQAMARRNGALLYAERPQARTDRLGRYWAADTGGPTAKPKRGKKA